MELLPISISLSIIAVAIYIGLTNIATAIQQLKPKKQNND